MPPASALAQIYCSEADPGCESSRGLGAFLSLPVAIFLVWALAMSSLCEVAIMAKNLKSRRVSFSLQPHVKAGAELLAWIGSPLLVAVIVHMIQAKEFSVSLATAGTMRDSPTVMDQDFQPKFLYGSFPLDVDTFLTSRSDAPRGLSVATKVFFGEGKNASALATRPGFRSGVSLATAADLTAAPQFSNFVNLQGTTSAAAPPEVISPAASASASVFNDRQPSECHPGEIQEFTAPVPMGRIAGSHDGFLLCRNHCGQSLLASDTARRLAYFTRFPSQFKLSRGVF